MKLGGIKRLFLLFVATLMVAVHIAAPAFAVIYSSAGAYIMASNKDITFTEGSLLFSDVNFHNFSNTSVKAFGVSGDVYNKSYSEITFTSTVTYYTEDKNEVAHSVNTQRIPSHTSVAYTQMSNLDIVNARYDVGDIYYYVVDIDIADENSTTPGTIDEDMLIPSRNPSYMSNDYVIDSYKIDIVVGEDNVYTVTENIAAYFNSKYKHGIFRTLPLRAEIERLDGTSTKIRTSVTDVSVDENFTTSRENGNLKIKIGDADKYVRGRKEYTIKYKYNFGADKNANYDEFYYNLIGTEWDTAIGGVSFAIHMPKEFDASKVGFSSGKKGSTNNDSVVFTVSGNDITGSYNGILGTNDGLTIRLELEDGYFSAATTSTKSYEYLAYAIPVVCAIISAVLWLIFGRDDHSTESVEFYPPEGLNSLDVALIMKGRVSSKDVISLLFVLANKGYVRIEETKQKSAFSRAEYTIYKLKEYDGDNENERTFFNGLFKGRRASRVSAAAVRDLVHAINNGEKPTAEMLDKVSGESDALTSVTTTALENKFYHTINTITTRVNKKSNRRKYFENTTFPRALVIIMMLISFLSVFVTYGYSTGDVESSVLVAIIILFYMPFFAVGLFSKGMPGVVRIIWLAFTTGHFLVMFSAMISSELTGGDIDEFYMGAFVVLLIALILMVLFFKLMPRRTPLGVELYGKIKGLKTFMKTADQARLEQMLSNDKNYAYLLLPYAFVLGVSTKWMEQFVALGNYVSEPSWYVGNGHFTINSMSHTMNSMMSSVSGSLSSSPSSSGGGSGGGSSGGGSSGGGGGGGGGGSW